MLTLNVEYVSTFIGFQSNKGDFMFQITFKFYENISSQFVMTYPVKSQKTALPLAFAEHRSACNYSGC